MKKRKRVAEDLGLPPGYTVAEEGKGHLGILDPAGEPLRSPTGLPIKVSLSPSDWRSRLNEKARVRQAVEHRERTA